VALLPLPLPLPLPLQLQLQLPAVPLGPSFPSPATSLQWTLAALGRRRLGDRSWAMGLAVAVTAARQGR
jgi:hypothetical protein